jgi:hypothetical protein
MTTKLSLEINHKKFLNHVPNLCSWPKTSRKKINIMFFKKILNAMIKNIKIHNNLNIIKISKCMKRNNCIQKTFTFKCFLWFFKVRWVQGKSKCDVLNGTTQGWAYPNGIFFLTNFQKKFIYKTKMLTSFKTMGGKWALISSKPNYEHFNHSQY